MKSALAASALPMFSALAVIAAAPSAQAKTLSPGDYNLGGVQRICLVRGGAWYGESFAGWSGTWGAGPNTEDGTVIHGNYNGGAGNDAMVLTGGLVDWTEWKDDESFQKFIDTTMVRLRGKCVAPATKANSRENPMD
jgi:hypothetical protein